MRLRIGSLRLLHRHALSQVEHRWIDPALWWSSRRTNWTSDLVAAAATREASCSEVNQQGCGTGGTTAKFQRGRRTAPQFVAALKTCSKTRDLESGKKLHQEVIEAGFHTNKFVASVLVSMYSKCRSMELAQQVFDSMIQRDVVNWTSLILGYVENGESSVAMDMFTRMDCQPNSVTYVAALKACGALASERPSQKQFYLNKGIDIHNQVRDCGFESDIVVATTLVDMYSKCGSMQQAREVFDRMIHRNAVAWTSLILGYVENKETSRAMDVFASMDCKPDAVTYVAALKACGTLASEGEAGKALCLEKGIAIHKQVKDRGFDSELAVANSLLGMYSKCGSIERAREVFDKMKNEDVFSWNSLILGYVENGQSSEAISLFAAMDCNPNPFTYAAALKACEGFATEKDKPSCLEKGIAIHKQAIDSGFVSDIVVANTLLSMYSKCGSMQRAREVFDRMVTKDVVTWNSLILGYVDNGESSVAMDLFSCMDCEPDSITYLAAIKACGSLASEHELQKPLCLEKAIGIHKQLEVRGLDSDVAIANSLLGMYSKCGSMQRAREVFDKIHTKNVVAWNCLILGYLENGESSVALDLFTSMTCEPSSVTYILALKACGALAAQEPHQRQFCVQKGIAIHREVEERGFDSSIAVATTLVDMYGRCGSMQRARQVFETIKIKDVVVWNSLILGYVENGEGSVAMDLFSRMDCEPNSSTFVAALKACGSSAALRAGEQIHATICKLGLEQDQVVSTALMDFYGKCGNMWRAAELFNNMDSPSMISWNSLIAGYTSYGNSSRVLKLVEEMQEAGLQMDGITFVSILTACSHAGLIEQGKLQFDLMLRSGITPSLEHYNCMVDLLGRANKLQEALALVKSIPFGGDAVTWRTLLGACRKWNNLEVGKVAYDALVAANPTDGSAYVLMSDIYRSLSMWQDLEEMESEQKAQQIG